MQFRIPQFLDIEDKVFGPLTVKQFAYLIGAIAFAYIFWKMIPYKIISILFILLFSGTFLALAFAKVNSRPFPEILESAYKFLMGNKMYVWKKEKKIQDLNSSQNNSPKKDMLHTNTSIERMASSREAGEQSEAEGVLNNKKISVEKLKELGEKLDILENKKININLRDEILKRGSIN